MGVGDGKEKKEKAKVLTIGLLIGCLLSGCASFSYRYFGLQGISYKEGVLLGPKAELDRPFSDCAPTASVKNPCVVMFATEFFKMKLDYEDTKQKLIECQRNQTYN